MLENPLAELEGEIDQVRVQLFEQELTLHFPYHKQALAMVKALQGAVYSPSDKSWCLPVEPRNTYTLHDTIVGLRKLFRKQILQAEQREAWCLNSVDAVVDSLRADFEHPRLSLDPQEGCVVLSVPYAPKSIRLLKKIEGARWDSAAKVWLLPADQEKKIRTALKGILRQLGG